jgi:hypothetical protein
VVVAIDEQIWCVGSCLRGQLELEAGAWIVDSWRLPAGCGGAFITDLHCRHAVVPAVHGSRNVGEMRRQRHDDTVVRRRRGSSERCAGRRDRRWRRERLAAVGGKMWGAGANGEARVRGRGEEAGRGGVGAMRVVASRRVPRGVPMGTREGCGVG